MRQVVTNSALIGMAIAFLVHFRLIAVYKTVTIQESCWGILALEVVGMLALIGLGVANLIELMRR